MNLAEIVEAIKVETDPQKQKLLIEQHEQTLKELERKAGEFENVEKKGIFKELKETKEKLEALEKEKKAKDDKDALEQGKFKELAEQKAKELEQLTAKYETEKAEAEAYRTYRENKRKELIEKLASDEDKDIANEIKDLAKLEKFVAKQTAKPPISTDDEGNPKPPDDGKDLTAEEIKEAKAMFAGAEDPIKEYKEFKKIYKKGK